VDRHGTPAFLKVITEPEERDGSTVMIWWAGNGAARVYAYDDDAILLERAMGERSLSAMSTAGHDREATMVLCKVAARLHARDPADRPATIVPLEQWFRALWPVAERRGGVLDRAATIAGQLLTSQRERVVLHGDLHHDNVLDFGDRGWLAIDPKGLYGERTFDFVNLLRNPEDRVEQPHGRFAARVRTIASVTGVDPQRLAAWTVAFTGLSAAWIYDDGDEPALDLAVAQEALAYLARDSAGSSA